MDEMNYVEVAEKLGREAALEDLTTGNDRSGEDVIADTEVLVWNITGKKLYEIEDDDNFDVIELIEAYDEAYIDTYVAGAQEGIENDGD